MVHFIKLHKVTSNVDRTVVYVNPNQISYMYATKNGGTYIIFCCTALKEQLYQSLTVTESIESILNLIDNY